MQHSKQVIIKGESYVLTHLQPTKAFAILTRLLRFIGGPLGASFEGTDLKELSKISEKDIKLSDLIGKLAENLDSPDAHRLVTDLMGSVLHNNQLLVGQYFENHFMGRLSLMFEVLVEQVKFQYEDFFVAVAGMLGDRPVTSQPTISQPHQTSSGQSGDSSSTKSRLSRKLNQAGV